jgi:photosystem II stability/assembly factor-like uncharacterized protein
MQPLHRILFAAALALAVTAPLSAGWSPVGGPVQPIVTLQLDPSRPDILYTRTAASEDIAVQGHYLWRSDDAGFTWRDIQPGLERPVMVLGIDPEDPRVIWAWASEGSLWRSGDAGDTWSLRSTFPGPGTLQVVQLLVDPHHPDTLYRVEVASDSFQLLVAVSRDGGVTFTQGAPFTQLNSVLKPVIAPADTDELLAFVNEGLRVSTDGGRSWQLRGLYRGAGFTHGVSAPSTPDTLYGIPSNSTNQCLARSDDDGAHWRSLPYPPRLPSAHAVCYGVAVDPQDALHVWVVAGLSNTGQSLLFESRNGGASWSNPSLEPSSGVAGSGVVAAGGERLYSGDQTGIGLYASSDGGRTWAEADHGILAGDLRDGLVAQRPPGGVPGRRVVALNTPLSGTPDDLYRSDGGQSWVKEPLQPVTIADAGGSVVLAGDANGVMRSRDGGTTWTAVPSAPHGVQAFRPNPIQPEHVALLAFRQNNAYGSLALWTSDDAGATWRRSSNGLPIHCSHIASVDVCPDFPAYAVDPFNPSRRWVSSTQAYESMPQLFLSEDAGATWSLATAALPWTLALLPDPTVPGRLLAGTFGGLFVSGDGGLHWSPLGDLPAGAAVRQLLRDPLSASWYAATVDRGIYRGLDGGAHWTLLAGAPDHDAPTIAVDPRRPTALLAAFRGQGLWRWTP